MALIFVYFFLVDLGDGSVSSFNIVLWMGILGGLAVVQGGGWFLWWKGYPGWAAGVLALVALPALGALALFLLILISNPRWN